MRPWALVLVVLAGLALTGCGSDPTRPQASGVTSTHSSTVAQRPCRKRTEATRRAEERLARDVRAIGRAAARPTGDRLRGNEAIGRATDRFLLDEGSLPVDNFTRNRFINRAIALSVAVCQQCFQALEAARPITQASLDRPGALPCPAGRS